MAYSTDHLFDEYTKLRINGMNKTEAAQALHTYLQQSSVDQRKELAQLMRAWENSRTLNTISAHDRKRLSEAKQAIEDGNYVICVNCDEANPKTLDRCRVCNYSLVTNAKQTDLLSAQTGDLHLKTPFGEDNILLLMPNSDTDSIRVKPQRFKRALTVGRLSELPEEQADIVLIKGNAENFGVSRLHAAIQYDDDAKMIQVKDLGSTNGTFINGRALVPHENNYLHDGDILRLGGFFLTVIFAN